MPMPAGVILDAGGWDEVSRSLALRFFVSADAIELLPPLEHRAIQESTAFTHIKGLSASQLLASGTSPFWYFVYQLYRAQQAPGAPAATIATGLLANSFDAFFTQFPVGASITCASAGPVSLPTLGVRTDWVSTGATIGKKSADSIEVTDGGYSTSIELASTLAEKNSIQFLSVGGGARLYTSLDLVLESGAMFTPCALGSVDAERLAGQIMAALGLVRCADPDLFRRIRKTIKWYFPVETPNKANVHNSLSIATFHGAIFLSESYRYMALLEALVHEYYHNELWLAMVIAPHVRQVEDAVLYSPWRPDPRPPLGVYHGIYVFTGLLEFFAACERSLALEDSVRHFTSRRRDVYFQLRTALDQLPGTYLDEAGQECLDVLRTIVRRHGIELGLEDEELPQKQKAHWRDWLRQNVAAGGSVPVPVGV
ncbi:aKG-HExxH-type peptide beta-hydroxylase [Luteitalea sp.]